MRQAPTRVPWLRLPALLLLLALGGCAAAEAITEPAPPPSQATLPIFYATNRSDSGDADPAKRFGAELATLSYGRAEISIPVDHKIGEIDGSGWEIVADNTKSETDFGVVGTTTLGPTDFVAALAGESAKSGDATVLVYVHGYNNSFIDAMQRGAQLAADLDWRGPVVVFSWPSHAALLDFGEDRKNAEASAAPLRVFLGMLANRADGGAIDLVAHSMGARVLLLALAGLQNTGRPFAEIVLAALEMPRDEYAKLVPRAVAAGRRVTVYASTDDMALRLVAGLGSAPVGDANGGFAVMSNVDMIDASAAGGDPLGHSYLGDSRAVLADLYQLLRHGLPPEQRFGLRERPVDGGRYWELKP